MYMLLCIMIAYNVMQGAKMKKSELIFNNIPFKNLECYNAQKTIEKIVKFLRGEKLYFYDRWHKNGSHFRLSKTILSELNALIHVLQMSLFHS